MHPLVRVLMRTSTGQSARTSPHVHGPPAPAGPTEKHRGRAASLVAIGRT